MAKIGVGGLVCSIIGFVLIVLIFVLSIFLIPLGLISTGSAVVLGTMITFLPFGALVLGIIGLILGIVGAAKDERKAPGIVGIVFGGIDLAATLLLFFGLLLFI